MLPRAKRPSGTTVLAGRETDAFGTLVLSIGATVAHAGSLPAAIRTSARTLPVFIALQCLDVLTTLVFLRKGLQEGNPLVGWALSSAHSPWIGLVLTKLIAALIGHYCYRSRRMAPLRWANAGYSLVVGWNLVAIAVAAFVR